MTVESLIIVLLVGLLAGWLAGQIVKGGGFGVIADICIGILGSFIGSWLLPEVGIYLGSRLISQVVTATVGAIILLLVLRVIRGSTRIGAR